ncbi:hypothetical protein [Acetobacter garciniae]|uniref:hypothetical protein n=1 Tax=Acetobacter garciniae TaxID=2817435 RepID=UPI001E513A4E|nr:hypothetical protein [Acetobacter garciniae]
MRKRMVILATVCLAMGSHAALAQEEDDDYRALMQKTTTHAHASCIDYLNAEHGDYSGDKMRESLSPDEVTKGLSKAIRDECQKYPKEPVDRAVANVRQAYTSRLSEITNKIRNNTDTLKSNGGA